MKTFAFIDAAFGFTSTHVAGSARARDAIKRMAETRIGTDLLVGIYIPQSVGAIYGVSHLAAA